MPNAVGIERIVEMPKHQGMYLYLCPCGETQWGKDRFEYFQNGWKAEHIRTCCNEDATHMVVAYEGTQRDLVEAVMGNVGTVMFVFHDSGERRVARYKWYMIQEIPA